MPAAARLKEERRAKRRNRWGNAAEGDGVKKKRSRWELADPGITEQVQLKLRLDDIQRKLALPDCGVATEDPSQRRAPARTPPPARLPACPASRSRLPAPRPLTRGAAAVRSPSPAPEYDSLGNRTNTREKRTRGKLLGERNGIIEKYQVRCSLSASRRLRFGHGR